VTNVWNGGIGEKIGRKWKKTSIFCHGMSGRRGRLSDGGGYFGKGRQPLFAGVSKMVGGFRGDAGLLGFVGGDGRR